MQFTCLIRDRLMENRLMKQLKLVLCLAALGNMLTGPFLGSSYSAVRLSMPFAVIDTTNCAPNSPTVWFAASNGDDGNDGKTPQTPMSVYGATHTALPGHRICFMGDRKSTRLNSSHTVI